MSKPRVKSEIRKQQYYIVTLPDCNHYFATCVIVTWQIQIWFMLCFSLYLRAIPKYKPPGVNIQRGLLTEGFLLNKFGWLIYGGPYTWTMGLFF